MSLSSLPLPVPVAATLVLVSRIIMSGAWAWATTRIWKHRDLPHANHALAGALAMTLSQALMMLETAIPFEILLFFMALAQLTLVISFMRLTRDFAILRKTVLGQINEYAFLALPVGSVITAFLTAR